MNGRRYNKCCRCNGTIFTDSDQNEDVGNIHNHTCSETHGINSTA